MKKSYLRSSFKSLNAALMLAFLFFMTGNLQAQCDQTGYSDLGSPCAQSVCDLDAFCCDSAWDSICAGEAVEDPNCCDCVSQPKPEVCGGGGGECPYDGPPCDSGGGYDLGYGPCTDSVCGSDSFCCDSSWDSICEGAAAADENCKECTAAFIAENCGAGQECVYDGPPCDSGGGYALGYGPCTDSVCSSDSFCCAIAWDSLCEGAAAADENCVECTAEYIAANCEGCDDAAEGPMIDTPCPESENFVFCGPQNVFWTPPTAIDNCVEPTVTSSHDPGDFFAVGTTVTYVFEDGVGQQTSCSFDITINPLPEIVIDQGNLPLWCQGVQVLSAKVLNIGDLAEPVTYFWNTGETTQSITVYANDTYDVEVMDGNGCVSTASIEVDENLAELISAHTILVDDEMDMDGSTVLSGGVGVQDADEVSIQNGSDITTFFVASTAQVDGSSFVNDWTVADSPLDFPPFISNSFNDNNNETIAGTVTLSGSNYGNVTVKSGATLNIGNGEMYMKSLSVGKGATINFNQSGILVIKQKMNIGMGCNINVDGPGVVVYVGDNASIGQGSTVAVDIYAPEGLDVSDSGAFMTTYMYGLFVSDELNSGDDVVWGWNLVCGEGGGGDLCVTVGGATGSLPPVTKSVIGFCPAAAVPTNTCDCPDGYVVVGYEGIEGGAYGPEVLSQFNLRCKELNGDGTLGNTVLVTCSNGSFTAGSPDGPVDAAADAVMVGAELRIGCAIDQVKGYSKPVSEIIAGSPNTSSTAMPFIGGPLGGAVPAQFAPNGNAIVGMVTYEDPTVSGISAGVAWRYAPISSCGGGNGGGDDCVPDDNDGDCFSANGSIGCEYNDCEALVCAEDGFCCEVEWDGICAGEAEDLCVPCGVVFNSSQEVGQEEVMESNQERLTGLVVFPNPSDGQITIAVDDFMGNTADLVITNSLGQRVWTQHFDVLETSRVAVDLTDARYPSGIYRLTMYVNGEILTKQIVLSK
jgi:hypothetical protein